MSLRHAARCTHMGLIDETRESECSVIGHAPRRIVSSKSLRDASDPRICSSALARCAPLQVLARERHVDMVVGIREIRP